MNVLMLSIDERAFEEGSEVRERLTAYGQLFDSLHVIVFTRAKRREERLAANTTLYPTSATVTLFALRRAIALGRRILAGLKGDIVITSQEAFTNIVASALKRQFGHPVEVQVHTDFLAPAFRRESLKNCLRYCCYRWAVKHADCIRVVSERIRRGLVGELGVPPEKITVLPVFVETKKLLAPPGNGAPRQRDSRERPVVLVVARLTKEKNVAAAIDIFAEVAKRLPHAALRIVGDGPERKSLESKVERLKLRARVHFEGWRYDPAPYYHEADILLVTSRYEGYGRMFVEAAASDLPIVSTDVGIIGEMFKDGESALVFDTAADGTEAVGRIAGDPVLAERLRSNARRAIAGLPDFPTYLKAYRAALERCRRSV